MEFREVLDKRFSVRKFSDRPVEEEKLRAVLEAGRICPTAVNAQPQRLYVLTGEEAFSKLGKSAKMRYGAPVVILVCADTRVSWKGGDVEPGYDSAVMDASIATTYMMLQATDLGLGSIWIRYMNAREIRKDFGLEEGILPVCLLPIGYIAEDCLPAPRHYQRNDFVKVVKFIK